MDSDCSQVELTVVTGLSYVDRKAVIRIWVLLLYMTNSDSD